MQVEKVPAFWQTRVFIRIFVQRGVVLREAFTTFLRPFQRICEGTLLFERSVKKLVVPISLFDR